jgi:glycosyltransferase involved in cell wall biosynthesis
MTQRINCRLRIQVHDCNEDMTERHYRHSTLASHAPKLLLVTNLSQAATLGGRGLLCKLHRDALEETFGEDLAVLELAPKPIVGACAGVMSLLGHIDGIDHASLEHLVNLISRSQINQVFIDGSNMGEVARVIKHQFPDVEIVTFFHNVEARFFLGSLRQARNARAFAIMLANYLAERKAVRHSDKLVTLSERDSLLLSKLYGRRATHVAPMALHDRSTDSGVVASPDVKFALFVGSAFYANQAGITWYADEVATRLRIKTYVVGHGLEKLKARLERSGTIEVVGSVPSLAHWYRRAHVVVAPIFDGSGMKTKVAEALMYGKRVIGTPEAFSGYQDIIPTAGVVCRTADEFVTALQHSVDAPFCAMNEKLRALYDQNYSYPAARRRLQRILAD